MASEIEDVDYTLPHGLAAKQGHAGAQFGLGMMYRDGRGVPRDYVEAHMWLNLAASRATVRQMALESRDGVAAMMTTAQIAEAQQLASEWKPK